MITETDQPRRCQSNAEEETKNTPEAIKPPKNIPQPLTQY